MSDWLSTILRMFAPPKPHDAEGQIRWQWSIFFGFWLLVMGVVVYALGAEGKISWVDPYVHRSELLSAMHNLSQSDGDIEHVVKTMSDRADKQDARLDFIERAEIESSIRAKLITRCMTSDRNFRDELTAEIDQLESQYYRLTNGQGYRQPSCNEL